VIDVLDRRSSLSWIEVDISAVRHNFREIRRLLVDSHTRVFAVVKADAYGHGAKQAATALLDEGADTLCVARVEEAVELRAAGVDAPMLVFAPPLAAQAHLILEADCAVSVCDREHVEALASAARAVSRRVSVHVKVDTGMARLGVQPTDAVPLLRAIAGHPELEIQGIMTHFPCADMKPQKLTRRHIEVFEAVRREIASAGFVVPVCHAANSAATMDYPEAHFDAVRPGISLYGQYPSAEVACRIDLRPAMSMKTRIILLKNVPAGVGLSYGHSFVTRQPSRIATVPLGYADGYPRHASNRAMMIVRGRVVPVVGRVCMDLTLLDVTAVPGVAMGDEVLAFGTSGDHILPADAVAATIGTIGYEMTTRYGRRLPRFFL
jgi:alanine racemase